MDPLDQEFIILLRQNPVFASPMNSGLERELARIRDKKNDLEETMKGEAAKNYRCFLDVYQFSKDFENMEMEDLLDKFRIKIPLLHEKLLGFANEAEDITKRWRQASLMLSKRNQILGFLEIPQFMDSCVRKCYYDEALNLYSYIQRIDRLHGKEAPLIRTIANEVSQFKELMISQLLKELYGNIQLPVALKIIGYLRRSNVYNETELRIKFLNARDAWLKSLENELPRTSPMIFMVKLIEIYRVNLFNTVIEYRALFAEDNATGSTLSPAPSSSSIPFQDESIEARDFGDSTILTSWILNKINSFLSQLQETLDSCLSNEYSSLYPIENLLDPCFYFGLSMSRIGVDFRADLSLIFQRVMLTKFESLISSAIDRFEANMENFSLSSITILPSSSSSPSLSSSSVTGTSPLEGKSDYEPPSIVLTFPPLTNLCNDLLEAFNQVRTLIPLALITRFRDVLDQSLLRSTQILINYHRTESSLIGKPEEDLIKRMISVYFDHLIPHIQKCLSAMVPVQQLAKNLGLSVLEYNRLKKTREDVSFTELNVDQMKKPFDYLLA